MDNGCQLYETYVKTEKQNIVVAIAAMFDTIAFVCLWLPL